MYLILVLGYEIKVPVCIPNIEKTEEKRKKKKLYKIWVLGYEIDNNELRKKYYKSMCLSQEFKSLSETQNVSKHHNLPYKL